MTLKSFAEYVGCALVFVILWGVIVSGDSGLKKCQERYSRDTCIHTMKGG